MHPFSDSFGSGVRVRELSVGLAKHGVEVYILTPYERSFDMLPNVHVVSIGGTTNACGISRAIYKASKFLYYTRFFPKIFSKTQHSPINPTSLFTRGIGKLLLNKGIDLIQVEQDAAVPFGISLKKATGLPLVVDIHNISSEELVASSVINRSSDEFHELQHATKQYLSQTDHTIVVSESMKDYVVRNYGLSYAEVSVVPPGGRLSVDKSFVKKREKRNWVVYAGLVARREHVDLFVKSIPTISKRNQTAQFYITNKGETVKAIKRLANELDVRPEFFWYHDYAQVNKFLASCTVGLIPSSNDVARQMGTPAKLFNYLSVGLPVIANEVDGWSAIIEREKVGRLAPDNPEEFGEAIASFLDDAEDIKECGINAIKLIAEKYNWTESARSLLHTYQNIISPKDLLDFYIPEPLTCRARV
jgi:glycosyltransferase involved in cell wall biosynthesis